MAGCEGQHAKINRAGPRSLIGEYMIHSMISTMEMNQSINLGLVFKFWNHMWVLGFVFGSDSAGFGSDSAKTVRLSARGVMPWSNACLINRNASSSAMGFP